MTQGNITLWSLIDKCPRKKGHLNITINAPALHRPAGWGSTIGDRWHTCLQVQPKIQIKREKKKKGQSNLFHFVASKLT